MKLIISGLKSYDVDEKENKLIVTCDSFDQVFELTPPVKEKRKERKLSPQQREMLERKNQAQELFDYWNEKGIQKHREFGTFCQFLTRKLKGISLDELKQIIDNYASVYDAEQKNYWWTLKCSIKKVLTDDRWTPDNFHIDDYRVMNKQNDREDDVKKLYQDSGMEYWK
jgi:hypothetical protein